VIAPPFSVHRWILKNGIVV